MGDAFVGGAEVFADVGLEGIDPFVEEGPGHGRRRPLLAREQPDGVTGADAVDDPLDRLPGEVGKKGLLPALLHPGKRQLHAADMRHDLEPILTELGADIPGGAVKEGIARGDDDHPAPGVAFDPFDEIVEPARHFQSAGDRGGELPRARLRPEKHLCRFEEPPRLGRHAVDAVVTDTDDPDLLVSRRHTTSSGDTLRNRPQKRNQPQKNENRPKKTSVGAGQTGPDRRWKEND